MSDQLPELPDKGEDLGRAPTPEDLAEVGNTEEWLTGIPWRGPFIATLCRTANVAASCRSAQISRETAYKHRRNDEAFREAWDYAIQIGADLLEQVAWRRATIGYQKTKRKSVVNARGQLVVVEEEVQDVVDSVLLMFLLNGLRPEKYKSHVKHEHSGAGGEGPVEVVVHRPRTPERFKELLEIAAEAGWRPAGDTDLPVIDGQGTVTNGSQPPDEPG